MLGVFQIWLNHFNAWKVRRGTVTAWILEEATVEPPFKKLLK